MKFSQFVYGPLHLEIFSSSGAARAVKVEVGRRYHSNHFTPEDDNKISCAHLHVIRTQMSLPLPSDKLEAFFLLTNIREHYEMWIRDLRKIHLLLFSTSFHPPWRWMHMSHNLHSLCVAKWTRTQPVAHCTHLLSYGIICSIIVITNFKSRDEVLTRRFPFRWIFQARCM